ncbi:EAL domain-containing protein [Vibrio kyushuensis]|uniref:putative bifunctional diguanylate cyclase/phosphodiesterase n=1 Tax=Vibrio kyushuensis TaxID=2910249 RepID=UPI003D0DF88E
MISLPQLPQKLHTPIWIYSISDGRVILANDSALDVWESDCREELYSRDLKSEMSEAVSATLLYYRSLFEKGESIQTWWHLSPKNKVKKILFNFSGIDLENGEKAMLAEVLAFSEHSNNSILFDADGSTISFNDSFTRCYKPTFTTLGEFVGNSALADSWIDRIKKEKVVHAVHKSFIGKRSHWFNLEIRWLDDKQQVLMKLINMDDEKHAYHGAIHESDHDFLTQVLNRKGIIKKIDSSPYVEKYSVLFIDIDGFKLVNDSYGHPVGDQLLQEITHKIKSILPCGATLARFGGDEFIIYLPEVCGVEFAQLVIHQCNQPIDIEKIGRINVGCSIGIANFPDHSQSFEQLINFADVAMLSAKEQGRNRAHHFAPTMLSDLHRKSTLRQQMVTALEEDKFNLVYQPIFDTKSGQLSSLESLMRWNDPLLGDISPSEFIPLAEQSGLMPSIGLWVVKAVCKQLKDWNNSRYWAVHINLSSYQLSEEFPEQVLEILDQFNVKPEQIIFEVTDLLVIDDNGESYKCLLALQSNGFSLQLDDFGSGFSNLDKINTLPISVIKLDKQFMNELSPFNRAVIKAIKLVCEARNIPVIAEGIETAEQLNYANESNIDYCQGFYLSRPVSPNNLDHFVTAQCFVH